tara:strand:- start:7524 stop:8447 length:924 start_codon:yes stop_codon:yes gene_type:complete
MKCVLWGYPLHTDTYSYVHEGFKKALERSGHKVYWFHDKEYPDDFDYDDCVFFTEGYADKNIPLRSSSVYYVHVCVNPQKYLGNVRKLIDVRYHQDSMDNDNYEFHHDLNDFEELETGVCIDRRESQVQGYDITYLAWATDLMPEEFDEDWVNIEREKIYYHIGSVSADGRFKNAHLIQEFGQMCAKIDVKTAWSNPWTNPLEGDVMRDLMQKSFLSPDLRNDTHKRWGTKTCRLFKTMSYGNLGLTNSPKLAEFAGPEVICKESIPELFEEGLRHMNDKELILRQMRHTKKHHTYVNRINGLLRLL